jgi:hypothetical protein
VPIEIFASKIVALLNRTAPRDLFDVYNMQKFNLFDESEKPLLRKCVMLYSAISSDTVPMTFSLDSIKKLPQYKVKTDLLPVLRRGEHFVLKTAQEKTIAYLSELLRPEDRELSFWAAFKNSEYRPELLFDDRDVLARIKEHPMALWKSGGRSKQTESKQEEIG